jgi:hypothetical protein
MLTYNKDTSGLELYDGSAFGPVGSDAGLIHIKTESFSGAVSHSFGSDADPIFSSDFKNYKIVISDLIAASNVNLDLRLRANTTDAAGSNYRRQSLNGLGTTASAGRVFDTTSISIGSLGSNPGSFILLDLILPFETKNTGIFSSAMRVESGNDPALSYFAGYHNQTVSYNGFTIFGNINTAGTVNIYGYKD